MPVTVGLPSVTVPVLSRTSVVMSPARGNASPPFTNTPNSAPFPVDTITAVGTASPIAHGQAMISTATAAANARIDASPTLPPETCSDTNQTTNVAVEIDTITGTKIALILSASRRIRAREPCASRISFTICARMLSLPK